MALTNMDSLDKKDIIDFLYMLLKQNPNLGSEQIQELRKMLNAYRAELFWEWANKNVMNE